MSKKMLDQEPSEIEMLLPFHAAGTLNARDARRVDEALASDPELARQYAVIREEYAETFISTRAWERRPCAPCRSCLLRSTESPCASIVVDQPLGADLGILHEAFAAELAWSASLGAVLLLLQAGVIGRRADEEPDRFVPDRFAERERTVRTHHPRLGASRRRRVRWCGSRRKRASPTSTALARQLSGLDRRWRQGGMFRLQFGNRAMGKDEVASLMSKLQGEKIVSLAVATP